MAFNSSTVKKFEDEIINLDLTSNTLDDYKAKCKREAEHLVKDVFPHKVLELNTLLNSDKLSITRLPDITEELNIPIPAVPGISSDHDEIPAKMRKIDALGDHAEINGSKVTILPNGEAPSNHHIIEIVEVIKPFILELIDSANRIKMWITYMIPRIEDGNNFGVSIQEETLNEARQVESDAAIYLDQLSRYFIMRGKLISKVAKYPHVSDFRRCIKELDEKEFISLRLVLCELRNHYATLHDIIIKNMEKIKKPRTSHTDNMY